MLHRCWLVTIELDKELTLLAPFISTISFSLCTGFTYKKCRLASRRVSCHIGPTKILLLRKGVCSKMTPKESSPPLRLFSQSLFQIRIIAFSCPGHGFRSTLPHTMVKDEGVDWYANKSF